MDPVVITFCQAAIANGLEEAQRFQHKQQKKRWLCAWMTECTVGAWVQVACAKSDRGG
jgi:hypothetical protein